MVNFQNFLATNFLFAALVFANAVGLLFATHLLSKRLSVVLISVLAVISLHILTTNLPGQINLLLFPAFFFPLTLFTINKKLKDYTFAGNFFISSNLLLLLFGLMWSAWYITTLPVSATTRALMLSSAPLILISLPSGIVQFIEQFEVLLRKNWKRPRFPLKTREVKRYPKVCIHVPTYAEPPDLVKQTLNKLSSLNYPNFEVLVIDNNTKDEKLWKPVEKHCQKLGKKFKFIHVNNLKGAKAGALNLALAKTGNDVEIISVIDADYQAEPNFLKALVPHFEDPNIGFVQTPHDYRGWEKSKYLRMCYWEYKIFFHTTMISLNERGATLTVRS